MEAKPMISIIVPVYKVEDYLPKCVESLRNQTYSNLEIILVDDGSPDSCGVLCDRYAREDARIRVIHKENGGLSSARNAGIDIAQGEYLGFVDSDDWVEPETYEKMLFLALETQVKLVCAGRYDYSEATGERKPGLCPPRREVISGEELVRRIFRWQNIDSAAWDKLYHRSLFREIRYPNGKIVEDVPTTYRIALDAGSAAMLNEPVYNYRHRSGSITTSRISEKNFHFPEHTEKVYAHILRDYPALRQEAAYLRVQSLIHAVMMADQASEEDRKRFAPQCAHCRKALRGFLGVILGSAMFRAKDKLTAIFLMFDLYRPARRIYHRLTRRG